MKRQEWTLLGCSHETTKLRNNRKCPAFAIILRNKLQNSVHDDTIATNITGTAKRNTLLSSDSTSSSYYPSSLDTAENKEVIILIRGSQSSMDWSLNLNDKPVSYTYLSGATGETIVEGKGQFLVTIHTTYNYHIFVLHVLLYSYLLYHT